ncbi:MAG: hypothetical protein HY815_10685 [Candidatus Riflebacteria bacterium]|nr:hypothetical protein [Candidatus Riflebacteria bacterium]
MKALVEALFTAEFWLRKYRTRGDARAEQGAGRSSSEYHSMARDQQATIDSLIAELGALLGPDGGPGLPLSRPLEEAGRQAALLRSVDDLLSFEDACFHARHPAWAAHVDRFRKAHERWRTDPRFCAMAPRFLPIQTGWTD